MFVILYYFQTAARNKLKLIKECSYEYLHLPYDFSLGSLKLPDTSNIKLEKIVLLQPNENEDYRILEMVSTKDAVFWYKLDSAKI